MKNSIRILLVSLLIAVTANLKAFGEIEKISITPVSHASFVLVADNTAIYVDPVGDPQNYTKIGQPAIILITHTHFDHLDKALLGAVKKKDTIVIGSGAAVKALTFGEAMKNGESKTIGNVKIEAVPAYNLTPERLANHPKGQGNGYVITFSGKRIYVSGDTEDIPEMRALKDIDYAFICMNLPYTMTPEQAASAVLAFKPKVAIPYHYWEGKGLADINKFKQLVSKDKSIEVRLLKWYK